MRHISIIAFGIILLPLLGQAQQIPVLDHYIFNPYLYNPARAGDSGFGNVSLTNRIQWVEMPDAPLSSIIAFDMPLAGTNVGIGATLFSDETHLINNYGAMFTYAYHVPFAEGKEHQLSIGLSAGVLNQRFDFLKGIVDNASDPALLNESENTMTLDLSAGINYRYKRLNIGFSVPQLLGHGLQYREPANLENVKFTQERHFLISAAYDLPLGNDFTLTPLVFARKVTGIPLQVDGNLLAGYRQQFFLGLGYRSVNDISNAAALYASASALVKERFNIAYSFEIPLDSEAQGDLGHTHEITVGYRFGGQTRSDRLMADRVQRLENQLDSIGGELRRTKETVGSHGEAIAELDAKVEGGIVTAQQMDALQQQIADNEKELARLREKDTELEGEIDQLKAEMSATKTKLAELEKGGGGSAYFDPMGSIYFSKGSSELDANAMSQLDAIHRNLSTTDGRYSIFLSGNASPEGSAEYNMALSVRRSNAVKKYLARKGMPNANVFILPYGEEVPQDGSGQGNPNDRRVDVFITK